MIFFESKNSMISIDDVETLLTESGLQVMRAGDALSVRWDDGPEFQVSLTVDPRVALEVAEFGEGTSFADEMRRCDARFEVGIEDLDEALDEMNTLIEVQCTLQEATRGHLFNSWNGELSGPDRSE